MITPLLDRDKLDVAGLERLIEHILAGGVHGLFILGTTGEGPSLSYRLRQELIERTCRWVAGRAPVLIGITDTAFVESINIACKAAEAGAQGLVLAAPYYFPMSQSELLEYIGRLAPELPLPVFLYNMPSHTKIAFELDTVRQAAAILNVVGFKDSSADMIYFHKLKVLFKDRPDFSLLVGPEELLGETVLSGGHGGVSGGANIYPQLYVQLYNAALAKNIEEVAALHKQVIQISTKIYSVGPHGSSYLRGLKCAVSCLGICSDFMAEPFYRFDAPERAIVRKHLIDLGLLA